MPTGTDPVAAFQHWYAARGKAPGTVYGRTRYLRRLSRDLDILTAQPDDLADWIAGHEWSAETRKNAREALILFYRWAHDRQLLPGPDPTLDIPAPRLAPPCPHPTSDAAITRARLRATPRERLMIDLGALAGLRRSEIATARTDWLEDDTLRVLGKGARTRTVPIPPELAERIRQQPAGYLFPGRFGGHVSTDHVGRHLSALLGPGFAAHSLRHRFATTIYDATGDLLAVQQLLGHSRPETTQRYVLLGRSRLRRAALAAS